MSSRSRGLTLIETLFACFILLVAFTIFATLFQWVLSSARRGDEAATASRLAANRLAELRLWAAQPTGVSDNFRAGNWAQLAVPTPLPEAPGYQSSVELISSRCYSPTTSLEALFATPREMSDSCKRVRIRVRWGGQQSFDLWSQLAAPPVTPNSPIDQCIQVTAAFSGSLAVGASGNLTAQALDNQGQAIQNLVYQWNVIPGTGSGSVVVTDRNGSGARFTNGNNVGPGLKDCQLAVTAFYRGQQLGGTSATVSLETPP